MPKTNPHVLPFFFQQSTEEVIDELNDDLPIKLKKWEGLVNRVIHRYPFISKTKVSLIIKNAFEVIRERLLLGDSLTFSGFLQEMKLRFYTVNRLGIIHPAVKVKLSASSRLQERQ